MVGGGEGAFIGDVHRRAIALDGSATLVAGCFSGVTRTRSAPAAPSGSTRPPLSILREMAEAEAARRDGIDFA